MVSASITYELSAMMWTGRPAGTDSSNAATASSSIRLFVVSGSPPAPQQSSFTYQHQPPGPGLRRHEPSVAATSAMNPRNRPRCGVSWRVMVCPLVAVTLNV